MKNLPVLMLVIFMTGCGSAQPLTVTDPPATSPVVQPSSTVERSVWSIYDPDPDHPWNRVFRQLYRRTNVSGDEYGADELDPLLWFDTTHLLTGESHRQALQVLDDFLASHAETLVRDPLKRAMFQRDLWAVFDWAASQAEPYLTEREALKTRLGAIMKRVALPKEQILSLPDNYDLALESRTYPTDFQEKYPDEAFLPADLFQADSAWVPIGREGGPVAMTHTEAFPFIGRSVFLVYVRSPDGRDATLDFIDALNTEPSRALTMGLEVALVRRMLLIDDVGKLMVSPLVETIQIRHYNPMQSFYEFELDRARLFDGIAGGLVLNRDFFMLFMSHGEIFENPDIPDRRATIPEICKACHLEYPPLPNRANTQSIISYSRQPFALPDHARPVLLETVVEDESQTVIDWKQDQETWKSLEILWASISP